METIIACPVGGRDDARNQVLLVALRGPLYAQVIFASDGIIGEASCPLGDGHCAPFEGWTPLDRCERLARLVHTQVPAMPRTQPHSPVHHAPEITDARRKLRMVMVVGTWPPCSVPIAHVLKPVTVVLRRFVTVLTVVG